MVLLTGPAGISSSRKVLADLITFKLGQLILLDRPYACGIIFDRKPSLFMKYRQNMEGSPLERWKCLRFFQYLVGDNCEPFLVTNLKRDFSSGDSDGLQLLGTHHSTRPVVRSGMTFVGEYPGEFHKVLASGSYAHDAHLSFLFAELFFDYVISFIGALSR